MDTVRYLSMSFNWLAFFTACFFAYYYFLKLRNRERMLLIEKNIDISEIYKTKTRKFPWFILGFTILGASLGIIACIIILLLTQFDDPTGGILLLLTSALLMGSIGIIVGNIVEKRRA